MKFELTSTRIINWICVLLILVMVALLFTPYWQYTTKEKNEEGKRVEVTKTISISDYVWFPRDHKDMTSEFEDLYEDIYGTPPKGATKEEKEAWPKFWINDLVLMPALVLVLGVVVGLISLWYSKVPFSAALALLLGSFSVYGYLTRPEFKLGDPTVHIAVGAATAALGLVGIVWFIIKTALKKKKTA